MSIKTEGPSFHACSFKTTHWHLQCLSFCQPVLQMERSGAGQGKWETQKLDKEMYRK